MSMKNNTKPRPADEQKGRRPMPSRTNPYVEKMARKRDAHRARALTHVKVPIHTGFHTHKEQRRMPGWLRAGVGILVLVLSVGLHVGFVLMAFGVSKLGGQKANQREQMAIEMREHEAKPKEPEKAKEPEPKKEPERVVITKAPPAPKIEAPPPEPEKKAPPRIVGLNFESTVGEGNGDGPAFAVGNTRMGETDIVAVKKEDVPKEAPGPVKGTAKPTVANQNQKATRLPVAGVLRVGAKVKYSPNPDDYYPPTLRAQMVEDTVPVVVTIDKEGKVIKVIILKPSIYPEFNERAKELAMKVLYEPETINGEAIETTIRQTIRFELKDK